MNYQLLAKRRKILCLYMANKLNINVLFLSNSLNQLLFDKGAD